MDIIELSDGEAVIESLTTGKPVDPEIARRIRQKAHEVMERIRREKGVVDIAVPTLREIRE